MAVHDTLFLHEELLLLALRDDKGTISAGSTYAYAVAGALLCFALRWLAIRRGWRLPVSGGDDAPG